MFLGVSLAIHINGSLLNSGLVSTLKQISVKGQVNGVLNGQDTIFRLSRLLCSTSSGNRGEQIQKGKMWWAVKEKQKSVGSKDGKSEMMDARNALQIVQVKCMKVHG